MLVTTVKGKKVEKTKSIMYGDKYYSKEDDCVKIGGKYYPNDHADISLDLETGQFNLKQRMLYGITGFKKDDPIFGYFTSNNKKNIVCFPSKGVKSIVFNDEIIPVHYVEEVSSGNFYNPKDLSKGDIAVLSEIRTLKSHTEKGYNIEDNAQEYEEKKKSYADSKPFISKKIKRFSRLLGNITFGIENEMSVGTIPEHIQSKLGLVLCRDGSTTGGEAVSVPMQGAKGVNNIIQIAKEMSKRTITDINCSYHIHIGNVNTSRVFLLSLYKLVEIIQDELFTMLPYYKTFWKGIKKKDYNKKLSYLFPIYKGPNYRIRSFKDYIRYNYAVLARFLGSNEQLPSKNCNRNPSKPRKHPIQQKWNINSRYAVVNLLNSIYSDRNTVEIRAFNNTTNPYKMVNWLFIFAAIVKYAEKNAADILTKDRHITLREVIDIYKVVNPTNKDASFVSEYLNAYIEERKTFFEKLLKKEDYKAYQDTKEDKDYEFFYKGKSIV